ncbi:MAG: AbrB/MazE/SpoVT family DNA-binding domain-containing protein [Candidatus Cloacimonadota bacterium]|jgi:AbrB family looped-hinge helix DNA binding protein|nr:MAG: AbrB/MazE/SpoVT family DNA-binding domain-containing protein [Candidatus Cloacimonadota bacterium]
MKPTRVTKKGQVTIPKAIRDFLDIKTGDKLLFEIRGKDVVVVPIKKTIFDFRGKVKDKEEK